jgi:dynein heavy chain
MSLLARHRYMISKLAEAFSFEDEGPIESMMLEDSVLHAISQFFSAHGPTKIIITYETAEMQIETAAAAPQAQERLLSVKGRNRLIEVESEPPKNRLKVHLGEVEYLPATAVYFMKTKKGASGNEHYAIDPSKINDNCLTFGVIREPLESLEVVMRCVYKPLIQGMGDNLWGQASGEQKTELMQSIDMFTKGLQESIRSISGGLDLKRPDERVEELGSGAAKDPTLVVGSLNLLQNWCGRIEKYLDDSDRTRWETPDSGPDTELDYWRNRMQRLNSITEQLKGKSVKSVISVLSSASRYPENDNYIDYQRVSTLLAQWREIDVQITEAANEAKDNVKYLSTLERFFDPLYGTDPSAIIDTLPALINGVKMIHTIARYFGTSERVTKLFMKITNQMIATCKLSINDKDSADRLWDKDLPGLLETIEKCLQLNELYQEHYR